MTDNVPVPELDRESWQRAQDRAGVIRARRRRNRWLGLLWLLIGPGVLVMLGENDAGSMITYASTGAQYGLSFFLPFIPLTFLIAFVVQEMTVRLGAVTHRGHAELIFERFGRFWGYFSLGDLALGNLLTLTTEFIGVGIGLSYFGVPLVVSVPGAVVLNAAIAVSGRYWTWERMTLGLAALNLVFVPLALMARPDWALVGQTFLHGGIPGGFTPNVLFLVVANLGATVTPWMLFFQQGAVVDKGLLPEDIGAGRTDTLIGAGFATLAALACMVATAVLLFPHHLDPVNATFAQDIGRILGPTGGALFALGLTEAGFVAATTISLSSSWAAAEVLKLPRSLNRTVRQAPWFYGIYLVEVVLAGAVVLVPGAPLAFIAMIVQVINTILMPPAMMFLLLLLNDRGLMGPYVNSRGMNIVVGGIAACLLMLSALYGLTVLFPTLLG